MITPAPWPPPRSLRSPCAPRRKVISIFLALFTFLTLRQEKKKRTKQKTKLARAHGVRVRSKVGRRAHGRADVTAAHDCRLNERLTSGGTPRGAAGSEEGVGAPSLGPERAGWAAPRLRHGHTAGRGVLFINNRLSESSHIFSPHSVRVRSPPSYTTALPAAEGERGGGGWGGWGDAEHVCCRPLRHDNNILESISKVDCFLSGF